MVGLGFRMAEMFIIFVVAVENLVGWCGCGLGFMCNDSSCFVGDWVVSRE